MHGHPPGQSAPPVRICTVGSAGGRRRRTLPATLMALALLAGASACSSDDNADPPPDTTAVETATTTTEAPTTTTTEPKSEEDEVAEAFLRAEAVYFMALTQPSSANSELEEHFEEPYLSDVQGVLDGLTSEGLVAQYPGGSPPDPLVREVAVDSKSATVEVCIVNNGQQVSEVDGVVTNDAVVSQIFEAEMVRRGESWLVNGGGITQSWPDGDGCDR